MDRFYIWLDWNVAWSSATATGGPHAASPPSVMLTAKIKRILSYSFICNVETAWPATISQGYYSCHVKTLQRQAEIFGFSYLYNSVGGTPCRVFRGFFLVCAPRADLPGVSGDTGTKGRFIVTCGRLSGLLISFRQWYYLITDNVKAPSYICSLRAMEMFFSSGCAPTCNISSATDIFLQDSKK